MWLDPRAVPQEAIRAAPRFHQRNPAHVQLLSGPGGEVLLVAGDWHVLAGDEPIDTRSGGEEQVINGIRISQTSRRI